jgi:hypothetical protein
VDAEDGSLYHYNNRIPFLPEIMMTQNITNLILGSRDELELEHRCYNGVCLTAALGCLLGSVFNTIFGMPLLAIMTTLVVGVIYLWLYLIGRRKEIYQPLLWLFILNGVALLIMTWFYNGGINGSDILISLVALVAATVVLKTRKIVIILGVFLPLVSMLFLVEYFYPNLVVGYDSREQRFLDIYLTLVVSTAVIFAIVALILQSYNHEKKSLDDVNRLLEEKMADLKHTNSQLEKTLAEVKTLSGLLPICSSCKKIRDDKGYWNQIETYIKKHSKAAFSHSICPECAEKLYPDLDIYK